MKFLIAILSVITLNIAQANVGTLESFFTPSLEKNDQKVVHLWMQNNCNQTVYVATKSESPQRIWETKGFMRIYPGELIRVGDLINEMYYLNATTADERIRWEGPHSFEIHNKFVRAAFVELPRGYGGNWTTILYCF